MATWNMLLKRIQWILRTSSWRPFSLLQKFQNEYMQCDFKKINNSVSKLNAVEKRQTSEWND